MNGYWREELLRLGAVPAEKNVSLRDQLLTKLRSRLKQTTGPLTFSTPEEEETLAREAIQAGHQVQREERYVSYKSLMERWSTIVDEFSEQYPSTDSDADAFYRDARRLDNFIKFLCQREILYQGLEWRCRHCSNRNWITIDSIGRTLECEVCRRQEPAPVSGDWHFRANPFLIEAYRAHGVEAVIYGLFQLWKRAENSFYFAPSMVLWDDYPEKPDARPIEVDALAVVDGALYLCEAKNSGGLSPNDKTKLIKAVERIRPNVLLLVSMDDDTKKMVLDGKNLQTQVDADVHVEVMGFMPEKLRRDPILPSKEQLIRSTSSMGLAHVRSTS
jgi:hypothetical protein